MKSVEAGEFTPGQRNFIFGKGMVTRTQILDICAQLAWGEWKGKRAPSSLPCSCLDLEPSLDLSGLRGRGLSGVRL